MYITKVNVFFDLKDEVEIDTLKTTSFPNDVSVNFCDIDDELDGLCLLITSGADEAREFKSFEPKNHFCVFYGDIRDCEKVIDLLDDVWPENESTLVRCARLRKMINYIDSIAVKRRTENLFHTLINSIPDMAWVLGTDGIHQTVNTKFCLTVEKTIDDIIGKSTNYVWGCNPYSSSDTNFVCYDSDTQVINSGKSMTFEENVKLPDGSVRKFESIKSPVFNEAGEVIATIGIAKDKSNIIEADTINNLIIDNMPFPCVLCSPEWKTLKANNPFKEKVLNNLKSTAKFDYLNWKKYFLTAVSEPEYNEEKKLSIQRFKSQIMGRDFFFEITEQSLYDNFGKHTGYFCMLRMLMPGAQDPGSILKNITNKENEST